MREQREAQILMVSHDNKDEELEPIPPFLLDMQLDTTGQVGCGLKLSIRRGL